MSRAVRSVLSVVLALAGAAVLLVTGSLPASACSCAVGPPATQAEADALLAGADAVFVGSLVARGDTAPGAGGEISSGDPASLTFAVTRVFKGDVAAVQAVGTARSSSSCGLEVAEGTPYLLFAERTGGALRTSLCSGSTPDLAYATWAGSPPEGAVAAGGAPAASPTVAAGADPVASDRPWLLAATAAAAAVALAVTGGLAVARRRRRPVE
ncbi:hypothetical protein [Kineosporia sp. A_224]|uniref:hypothetical protein n=1 Tax=Kineosporia sp. A_224 TaxID=1962180 RepID=UPI000B4A68D5|nr:hypothetical protein [Kineosporia sp. A_224]